MGKGFFEFLLALTHLFFTKPYKEVRTNFTYIYNFF